MDCRKIVYSSKFQEEKSLKEVKATTHVFGDNDVNVAAFGRYVLLPMQNERGGDFVCVGWDDDGRRRQRRLEETFVQSCKKSRKSEDFSGICTLYHRATFGFRVIRIMTGIGNHL